MALSRVRRLSGLYLLGINEHALKVHPEILEKDIDFKNKSQEAVKVFQKLSKTELQKMHDNFVVACGGKIKKQIKREIEKEGIFGKVSVIVSRCSFVITGFLKKEPQLGCVL